ncbi:hypothetical protein PRIP_13614 [Listeria riparia FSL S10-1204]|uniref:Uncharacterized protein n=1 Tax=Listeria riparia FSL S10-1204 TaxID=1265816 RepID=W7D6F0_9LIST|nr:hypothetical protein PRIP_13614 [Listeria riparia FSL S10-1204]
MIFSQGFIDQLAIIAELLVLTGKHILNHLQGLIGDNNATKFTYKRKISFVFSVNYVVLILTLFHERKAQHKKD